MSDLYPTRTIPFSPALCLLFFACAPRTVPSTAEEPPTVRSIGTDRSIEAFFDEELKPVLHETTPGAVVVAVRDGQVVLLKGYGYADAESKIPANPELSVFRAGSVSKTFTATALVMKLHEKGISLDEPVERYLPGILHEQSHGTILIRHLLTHSAGLDETLTGLGSPLPEKDIRLMDELRAHFPEQIRPPGFAHVYSNHGMAAAGAIYERLAGRPFVEAIHHDLLNPLGMKSSAFFLREDIRTHLSRSYRVSGGERTIIPNASIAGPPAGSLYTTAADMGRYLRVHLGNGMIDGKAVLPAEVISLMHRRHFSAHPSLPGSALAFYERFSGRHRGLEHSGDWEGFASQLIFYPREKLGYFISMNGSPSPLFRDELAVRFSARFLMPSPASALPDESVRPQKVLSLEKATLNRYAGSYRWARFPHSGFFRSMALVFEAKVHASPDGTLRLSVMGLPDRILVPADDGTFFEKESELRVFFHEANGRVIGASAGGVMLPFYFERVPLFESRAVQLSILATSFLILLGVLLFRCGWGIAHLYRRLRQRNMQAQTEKKPGRDHILNRLLLAIPLIAIAYPAAIAMIAADAGIALIAGLPVSLRLILWLPLLLIVLWLWLLTRVPGAWKSESVPRRAQIVLVSVATGGLLLFLDIWNLTGWQN